jgi:hypothetical protein
VTGRARSRLLLAVKLAVAGGIIAWLISSGKLNAGAFRPVLGRGWRLAACAGLLALVPLLGALRWRLLLACQGFAVPYRRVLHLGLVGLLFNCFGIGYVGGDVVKGYYAAVDQPRGRRAEAVTTVLFDRVVGLAGLLLLALLAMACRPGQVWSNPAAPQLRLTAVVFLAILAGMVAVFLLSCSPRLRQSAALAGLLCRLPGGQTLLRVYRAVAVYRARPGTILAAVGISLLAHSLNIAVFWQLARALDFPPIGVTEFAFCITVGLAVSSFGLPLGIGLGQLAFGFFFHLLWQDEGFRLGGAMATLQQGLVLLFSVAVGLPAFLAVRADSVRVRAEMAEDQAADGAGPSAPHAAGDARG